MTGPHEFIEHLLLQFMAPAAASTDPDGFVKQYTDALGQFTPKVLGEVEADLVQFQASGAFPSVADVLKRCRDKRDLLSPKKTKNQHWTGENVELANKLVLGELGKQAVNEGWIVGLWDFIREKGRRPNGLEADKIKAATASAEKKTAELGQGVIAKSFRRASAMRKERLTKHVLNGCE